MNRMTGKSVSLLLLGALVSLSCSDPETFDEYAQLQKEVQAIDSYIQTNNLNAVKHVSGVTMVITQLGSGLPASIYLNPDVEVNYVGKVFSNGTVFEQGTADGKLNSYIVGWRVALSTLPQGSKATVYIPSAYAYGNSQQGAIPANSTLVFDIDFKEIDLSTDQKNKFKSDSTAIKTYLDTNVPNAQYDLRGMWYNITQTGLGPEATWYDKVEIEYTFKNLSGTTLGSLITQKPSSEFDSRVVDYLNGMQIGLQHMSEGSKATFYIPSNNAFGPESIRGADGNVMIPANTNLVVEMHLKNIVE